MGERLNGIQEASGSIPLISTKVRKVLVFMRKRVLFYLKSWIQKFVHVDFEIHFYLIIPFGLYPTD